MSSHEATALAGSGSEGTGLEAMVEPAVQVTGVNHYFGEGETRKQALTDNNVTLMPGEMVIMTGPSGSGKTTLLTLIGGLTPFTTAASRCSDARCAACRTWS